MEKVAENALETARAFEECGRQVDSYGDLDGAKTATANEAIFLE